MLKPTFSIIIPVYNAQKTISRSIESVLLQEMQDFELILVNDGSSDNSLQICKKYENDNHKIRVIDKENGGVSSARNEGINNSNGEYIVFLDSDDTISAQLLTLFYKSIKERNVDLVFCNFTIVTSTQRLSNVVNVKEVCSKKDISNQFEELYNSNLLNCCWGKCFKRDLIKCKFNTNIQLGEDFLFVLNYLKNAKTVYYLNKELYDYYFFSDSTLSFTGGIKRLENLYEVYNQSKDILQEVFETNCFEYAIERKFCINILDSAERIARSKKVSSQDKYNAYNSVSAKICNLDWKNLCIEDVNKKFALEYKLLKRKNYRIYTILCKIIYVLHLAKIKLK